jgi:Flp pilus assembly pilin Flp
MEKIAAFSFLVRHAKRLAADRSGATVIEYAIIASMLSIVIVVGANSLGVTVTGLYQSVANLMP